jgi:methionine sulfoxide reductase heme-binding subunit
VTLQGLLWLAARITGLSAAGVIAATFLAGVALRSSLFSEWLRLRELATIHRFLTWCWAPLIGLHVGLVVLDPVSRITPLDVLVPLRVSYASLAVGLGTLAFDLLLLITTTSYMRGRLSGATWRRLHRLTYPFVVLVILHALLAGTDLARPVVRSLFVAIATFTVVMAAARLVFGRLETG